MLSIQSASLCKAGGEIHHGQNYGHFWILKLNSDWVGCGWPVQRGLGEHNPLVSQ